MCLSGDLAIYLYKDVCYTFSFQSEEEQGAQNVTLEFLLKLKCADFFSAVTDFVLWSSTWFFTPDVLVYDITDKKSFKFHLQLLNIWYFNTII